MSYRTGVGIVVGISVSVSIERIVFGIVVGAIDSLMVESIAFGEVVQPNKLGIVVGVSVS